MNLATSYLLAGLPNVKIMDALYFVAAYEFGLSIGIPIVVLTRVVYASANPWGPASSLLIAFLVLGDMSYVVAGHVVRRFSSVDKKPEFFQRTILLGLVGLFSAFLFDLITNFATGLLIVSPGKNLIDYFTKAWLFGLITMNFPLPLGIIHEVTDFIFFVTVVPTTITLLKRSGIMSYRLSQGLITRRADSFAK